MMHIRNTFPVYLRSRTIAQISGAGSDKNRALPNTSIKLCRTTYRYELFAKCFLANQKSPYFQNGGPDFKMAANIYYNVQKLIHLTHSDGSF